MRALLLAALVVGALSGCGDDAGSGVDRLTVDGAWSRPTPTGASNGVIYLTITSPVDDAITGVSVPAAIAASADLHETMGAGGVPPMANMPDMTVAGGEMTMAPLAEVPLPPDQPVVFEAGGKHIMLNQLAAPLVEGQTFVVTLQLREAGTQDVTVLVTPNPPG